ncbi:MAG: hypothetical protein HYX90_10550 [Chloroflexi bacterium]|nr:hypothetical protein [Chloroflexota bacterium]
MTREALTNVAFVHRNPTDSEMEVFRLCLSTFQDGSGQLKVKSGTLPGWRDFERTIGEMTGGLCTEDKSIFDVVCPYSESGALVGISCKMRKELSRVARDGRVTIELSNSSRKMWSALGEVGITVDNYRKLAPRAGETLVNLVRQWHREAETYGGKALDISKSIYLSLLWDQRKGTYQLFKFRLDLPDPSSLKWYFSTPSARSSGHLNGDDDREGHLFEWYGESGGQLKYYPHFKDALWHSSVFKLAPIVTKSTITLSEKASTYFPKLWRDASKG